MRIITYSPSEEKKIIHTVCVALRMSGLIIIPSDTVYALVVDATNQKAVNTLLDFKKRPPGKAISIFAENVSQVRHIVSINKKQMNTLFQLIPGPFTVVLSYQGGLACGLASEKNTLGVRLPDYPFIQKLLVHYGRSLTATSANVSGRPPHYSIRSLLNTLSDKKKKRISMIVDRGTLPHNKPSTVVDLTGEDIHVLRQGDYVVQKREFFTSNKPRQTKKIGSLLLRKHLQSVKNKPLVFLIEGELGAGKTVFVQGVGEALGVTHMVSPTFVIYYEYPVQKEAVEKLYHFDLYAIDDEEEFHYLKIRDILQSKNVICIEWGEKSKMLFDQLNKKGKVIHVRIIYKTAQQRDIQIC